MYYITLFIQKNDIQSNDIISTIITIKKKIENEIFFNDVKIKSDIQYRLILDDSLITKQKLSLPNIELSDYEIESQISLFIKKSSLNDEKYSYHYKLEQQNFKNLVFTIFIYPVSLIFQCFNLFDEKNIKFLGYQENQIDSADLSSEKFISTENIDGINFLPLKELQKKIKKKKHVKNSNLSYFFIVIYYNVALFANSKKKRCTANLAFNNYKRNRKKQCITSFIQTNK